MPPSQASGSASSSISPSLIYESQRQILIERYGLNDWQRQEDVDNVADIARAVFGETIVVTALVGQQVIILGKSLKEGDVTNWEDAVSKLSPVANLGKRSARGVPTEVFVVDDAKGEWQGDLNEDGAHAGFYAFAPINLPISTYNDASSVSADTTLPIGGFIVVSPNSRPAGSFTAADQALLLSLSGLVTKELMRGHDEIRRNRNTAQAAFVSEFLERVLAGERQTKRPQRQHSYEVTSPSMDALRDTQATPAAGRRGSYFGTFANRNAGVFSLAVNKLCELTSGDAAMILDLRAFSASTSDDMNDSSIAEHPASNVPLQPITVLGSEGFDDVVARLEQQEGLQAIEAAIRGWRRKISARGFRNQSFDFLLPITSQASLAVPILDHNNIPVLLVLLSFPYAGVIDDMDKAFVKNVGQLCLSTLLKEGVIKADKSKLAFVSQMAHELRTPIHGLAGQLELVKLDSTPAERNKFAHLLAIADICLDSLAAILDDTLDFAKLSNDADLERPTPVHSNDRLDLCILLSDITKATWARKMRSSASSDDDNGEKDLPEAISSLDVILDYAEREEGWDAQTNRAEIRRIVSNLVGNAFTFTQSGFIRIALRSAPRADANGMTLVTIIVSDSGCGIEREHLTTQQIFAPFWQADTFFPGCGLGLSLVKDVVGRMHGSIEVQSTVGEGTTVTVRIPMRLLASSTPSPAFVQVLSSELNSLTRILKQRATTRQGFRSEEDRTRPPVASAVSTETSVNSHHGRGSIANMSSSRASDDSAFMFNRMPPARNLSSEPRSGTGSQIASDPGGGTGTPAPVGEVLRVFCAEDNVISRNLLTSMLKKKGYSVKAVEDGLQAVTEFKKGDFRPNVSVLDIGMPHMDGLEAAFAIRAHEEKLGWIKHRMIALTALTNEADRQRGVGEGGPFDDWMTKGGNSLKRLEQELAVMQQKLMSVELTGVPVAAPLTEENVKTSLE